MEIWMVYDREGRERNRDYIELYRRHGSKYHMDVVVVLNTEAVRRVQKGGRPVCVFVRTIQPELNRFFEENHIPVFNSYEVSRICNHKGRTLQYFRENVLCVPSITIRQENLSEMAAWEMKDIQQFFTNRFEYSSFVEQERALISRADDFVLKTVDGHGGREVYSFCRERDELYRAFCQNKDTVAEHREYVFQPMIVSGQVYRDMRVYVIGTRILAAVVRSSPSDFRANFSLGGMIEAAVLTPEQKKMIDRIVHRLDFGMAGIDFLFADDDQLVLNEIEDVAGARMLYECVPDIDIVEEYLTYVWEQKLNRCKQAASFHEHVAKRSANVRFTNITIRQEDER